MAHRGRLNVLVNVLGKSPQDLFSEFEGAYDLARLKGSGDVKYHKGYSADVRTPGGNVHIALGLQPVASRDRRIPSSRARCVRAKTGAATRSASKCCRC